MTSDMWVDGYRSPDGGVEVHHLNGVAWDVAPIPRRLHRCRPQTEGWTDWFTLIQRCACGAIRRNGSHWMGKNERRKVVCK